MEDQLECKRIMSAIYVLGTKNAQKTKQTKIHCCISMLFNKRVVSKTRCLKEIDQYHSFKARKVYRNCCITSYWIINNSSSVHQMIKRRNEMKDVENIATYDFSTLYTNIPHQKLKERMKQVVEEAYEGSGKKYLSVYKSKAAWVNNPKKETAAYKKEELIDMIYYLIDNVYVTCGDSLFR